MSSRRQVKVSVSIVPAATAQARGSADEGARPCVYSAAPRCGGGVLRVESTASLIR